MSLHAILWIPLPLLGSVYPLSTKSYFGGRQDLGHPRYRALRKALLQTFSEHENLIYVSGHEHSLQYFEPEPGGTHLIISGAGSRPHPVGQGRGVAFTHAGPGHSVVNVYEDGTVWMEMWQPQDDGSSGRLLFRTKLKGPTRNLVDPKIPRTPEPTDYADSTVVKAINPDAIVGRFAAAFTGRHHRALWATPVEVPVLDIGKEAGGLVPVKRGGGQQTLSLRLENPDGVQYVLRSINKDAGRSLPEEFQGTFAEDVIQDQLASLHPFAAFAIPSLADAAGIYHTNPKLVYVPDDNRLGVYKDLFAGRIMMLEERPDDDMSDWPSSGSSKKVISARSLYEAVNEDNDHRVDQAFFARSRLFDMWISDWDRHKDQWRWASFEPYELDSTLTGDARKDGKIYRPIPRDRDWAMFRMNGLFPTIIKQKYFFPKFQDFRSHYGYVKGLLINGLSQDRRFMNALSRAEFVQIAKNLQQSLTDDVIHDAIAKWPAPIVEKDGEKTIRLLKERRTRFPEVAEKVYEILARVVDIVAHVRVEDQPHWFVGLR